MAHIVCIIFSGMRKSIRFLIYSRSMNSKYHSTCESQAVALPFVIPGLETTELRGRGGWVGNQPFRGNENVSVHFNGGPPTHVPRKILRLPPQAINKNRCLTIVSLSLESPKVRIPYPMTLCLSF